MASETHRFFQADGTESVLPDPAEIAKLSAEQLEMNRQGVADLKAARAARQATSMPTAPVAPAAPSPPTSEMPPSLAEIRARANQQPPA